MAEAWDASFEFSGPIETRKRGVWLLKNPATNKGLAFTKEEREALGLKALLPPRVLELQDQVVLELAHLRGKSDPLEQYVDLAALQDRNEVLFYRLLADNLNDLMPIVYTPTVGLACQRYSHIHRNVRGIWLTPDDRGRLVERLQEFPYRDVRLIVVTDNERILGLGDQGAGGINIPVGKLALYVAGAGIHPSKVLPISLDVGTDNPALLEDPFYIGLRERRLRGAAYDDFIEAFVQAVARVFPNALLQWEDFHRDQAFEILDRYRGVVPSFNDDIQGTAAVVLAGVLAGLRVTQQELTEQRFLYLGAGTACAGVHALVCDAMRAAGADEPTIARANLTFDVHGLVHEGRGQSESHYRTLMAPAHALSHYGIDPTGATPEAVIGRMRPTVLIAATAAPGAISAEMLKEMATHVERPIVLPLSNPNSRSECSPSEALEWTDGRALVATGSPFKDVTFRGEARLVGQANNVFIFPGVGLGVMLAGLKTVPDEIFYVAANALAEAIDEDRLARGGLYPDPSDLRRVSAAIAVSILRFARETGLGRSLPDTDAELRSIVEHSMWDPAYRPFVPLATP